MGEISGGDRAETFMIKVSASKETFKKEAADIMRMAETEGLDAHANSVKVRL